MSATDLTTGPPAATRVTAAPPAGPPKKPRPPFRPTPFALGLVGALALLIAQYNFETVRVSALQTVGR